MSELEIEFEQELMDLLDKYRTVDRYLTKNEIMSILELRMYALQEEPEDQDD